THLLTTHLLTTHLLTTHLLTYSPTHLLTTHLLTTHLLTTHLLTYSPPMYHGQRIIAIVPAYNEEQKISQVVARTPREIVDRLLVVDDGSTDRTAAVARSGGAEVLSLGKVLGVGSALRSGLQYARRE